MKANITINIPGVDVEKLITLFGGEIKETTVKVETSQPEAVKVETSQPEPLQQAKLEPLETDVEGLPWDERIHASTKTQKKDGTWKRGRGVDDATYDRVVAELKNKTLTGEIHTIEPEPAPVQSEIKHDFMGLTRTLARLIDAKKIGHDYAPKLVQILNNAFTNYTIATLTDIVDKPEVIEYAFQQMKVDQLL